MPETARDEHPNLRRNRVYDQAFRLQFGDGLREASMFLGHVPDRYVEQTVVKGSVQAAGELAIRSATEDVA